MEKFTSGEVDTVDVVFTDFVNTLVADPERAHASCRSASLEVIAEHRRRRRRQRTVQADATDDRISLRARAPARSSSALLPHYVNFQVYQMVLDARASEHSARMVAMKNATDNAKQLIKDLTLEYNKVRQAAITTELLEITTAQMALG